MFEPGQKVRIKPGNQFDTPECTTEDPNWDGTLFEGRTAVILQGPVVGIYETEILDYREPLFQKYWYILEHDLEAIE